MICLEISLADSVLESDFFKGLHKLIDELIEILNKIEYSGVISAGFYTYWVMKTS